MFRVFCVITFTALQNDKKKMKLFEEKTLLTMLVKP